MLWLLLLLSVVLAQNARDIERTLNVINGERSRFKLPHIRYNHAAQIGLEQMDPGYWFNKTAGNVIEFPLGPFNRTREYNLYFHIAPAGMQYLFHDSIRLSMSDGIGFRTRQRSCYDSNKCSRSSFGMFYTCGGKPEHVQSGRHCSWFFHHYPYMVMRSLTQMSCIIVDRQDPEAPTHVKMTQKKAFICYGSFATPEADYSI